MKVEDVNKKYDKWHEELDAQKDDDASGLWYKAASAFLGDLKGQKVLEIGCGRGGFSKFLLSRGADLVAADFSEAAVAIAKRKLADLPSCETRVADIQAIPFEAEKFDTVISLETLEHVPDPKKGLAELVRVTKPGGRLIITTPNYFGGLGLYRIYRNLTGRPYSEVGQPICTPVTLLARVRELKKLGCDVDIVDGWGHYLYLPGRVPTVIPWLNEPRIIMKWFATHSLTVATKKAS